MKNRTLTFLAACLAGMSAFAQWAEPTMPTAASELVAGNNYQVRNKETMQYLTSGTSWYSWSTSTILLPEQESAIVYTIDQTEDEYGSGWTFVNTATGKYTFVSGLFSVEGYEGLGEMHVDMAAQGNNHFEIETVDASAHTYRIKGSYTVYDENGDVESVATGYWGYINGDEIYPTAVYGLLDPSASSDYYCTWEFVDFTTYDARVELYNALVNSLNYPGVDVSSASAVYDNASASLAEIEAATDAVREAINKSITEGASEDNPVDVTSMIGNADFSEGSLSPWENTTGVLVYSSDGFPNSDCNLWDLNDNESFQYAAAAWVSSSGSLGDEDVHQDLGPVPAGMYTLTCSLVAQHSTDMPTGVFLYANSAELECQHDEALWASLVAAGTTNQLIQHPALTFLHEGGDLTIGVKLVETNCNWVYFSNFKLTYYGETERSAAYLSLQSAITAAQDYTDTEANHYTEATAEELVAAIATAEAVLASAATDEQLEAAQDALNEVVSDVKAEITAYNNYLSYIQTVYSDMEKYDASGFDDIASELSDLYYSEQELYETCGLTTDEIQEHIDAYNTFLANLLREAMSEATVDNPIEVTMLYLQNADLSEGTMSPWENTTGVLVYNSDTYPNGDCNLWEQNNNVTYNHWLAAWVSSSGSLGDEDVHQTINNLPAGSYIFSCMMVAQHSSDMPEGVYLYSDGSYELTTEMKHDDALWASLVEEGTYNQLIEYPQHVFYHTGGDVTVGLRLKNTNCNWVYASKFTLSYAGVDINSLYEVMQTLRAQAEDLGDQAQYVNEADNMLNDALDAADNCSPTDEDEILAVIDQLNETMTYINESIELMETLEYNYIVYTDYLIDGVESDYVEYDDLLTEIGTAIEDGYESNEQIQGFIDALASGFTAYVQYPVLETASEEEPGDITAALLNADFEGLFGDGNYTDYWTMEVSGGTNGYGYEAYECYNNTSFRVSQTVLGLADGYYRVRMQGFYRAGTQADNADSLMVDPDYGQNVMLFANTSAIPVCNILTGATAESLTGGDSGMSNVEYNGESVWVPNNMENSALYFDSNLYWNKLDAHVTKGTLEVGIYKDVHIASDWTIWKGFELYYLGTEEPTAVESIYDNGEAGAGIAASTQYFSVDGVRQARLTKGINIIKTTLDDGSVRVQKVLVK